MDTYAKLDETERKLFEQRYPREGDKMVGVVSRARDEGIKEGERKGVKKGEAQLLVWLLEDKFGPAAAQALPPAGGAGRRDGAAALVAPHPQGGDGGGGFLRRLSLSVDLSESSGCGRRAIPSARRAPVDFPVRLRGGLPGRFAAEAWRRRWFPVLSISIKASRVPTSGGAAARRR